MEEFYVSQLETEAKECAKRMASFIGKDAKARNALNELDEKLGSSWMTSSSSARGSRI